MESNLFNHININKDNTHFPNVNLINEQYQQLINKHHQVDLAILGVGNNGHIAFNEPGTSLTTVTHVVDLTVSSRQANARFFNNDINNVPTQAITVGLKEILAVKKIVLIAIGDAKKQAIEHLKHAQQFDSNWPITALINHRDVTIYTVGINF
jgi:glucosamine-6-phosphate deaminase